MTADARLNPSDHLINLQGKDYLPVAWRIAWFRDLHPEGIINTELVEHDPEQGRALFKATVTRRTEESEGSATGYGSETQSDFRDYVEKAETKALGRALAALGFGTQFTDDFDEGGSVTDAPITRNGGTQARRPAAAAAAAPPAPKRATAAIADKPDPITEAWLLLGALYPESGTAGRAARLDHIQGRFPDIVSGEGDKRKVDFTLLSKDEITGFVSDLKAVSA